VGQRKGLGYAGGKRTYVLEIVPESNRVVLGDREDLLASGLIAAGVNWLTNAELSEPIRCSAKIRYRHPGAAATVSAGPDANVAVSFDEPQSAIALGPAVVFYDGNRVLGRGWIERGVRQL